MKSTYKIIFFILLSSCSINKDTALKNNGTFHEDITAKVIITDIDTSTIDLYNIYRFQFNDNSKNGIILKYKEDSTVISKNKIVELHLCDVRSFKTIFRERDTTYIGDTPIFYGQQEGLKNNIDTITFRGHFMLSSIIKDEQGKIILDFGKNAAVPVFEICRDK